MPPFLKNRIDGVIGIHELSPAVADEHHAGDIGFRALGKHGCRGQGKQGKQEYEFFHGGEIVHLKLGVSVKPTIIPVSNH
jgi:hypothetical protein